jgi:hypothetical protein
MPLGGHRPMRTLDGLAAAYEKGMLWRNDQERQDQDPKNGRNRIRNHGPLFGVPHQRLVEARLD